MEMLEKELVLLTAIPVRPKLTDFTCTEEIGEGNFSRIFKAVNKHSGTTFAMKVIKIRLVHPISTAFSSWNVLTVLDNRQG